MTRLRTGGLDNVTGQHKFYNGVANDTIMGAPQLTTVEIDIGNSPLYSGSFDISGSGFNVGRTVIVNQACGPYTGKGDLPDETEMDLIGVAGYVLDSSTIRCYWTSSQPIASKIKFNYQLITQQ